MAYMHSGVSFTYKEWNPVICRIMGGPEDNHVKWSKSETEKYPLFSLIWGNFKKKWQPDSRRGTNRKREGQEKY
jgi:hypothetical protein